MIEYSKMYRGEVAHRRISPTEHTFSYPMTFFSFDLSELKALEADTSLFGYNQSRPIQIRDSDYLRGFKDSIANQLDEFLPEPEDGDRTLLITSPRYFGYAFNPVNFYLRLRGETLISAVAEVNNTFGDRHIYPLTHLDREDQNHSTASCPKDFHVSPFNDLSGMYRFTFKLVASELFIGVDLYKKGECTMQTWISGKSQALTNHAIIRYAFLRPLDTALNTMPRILWQAAKLYFEKKLRIYRRPSPQSENTVIDRDSPDGPPQVI